MSKELYDPWEIIKDGGKSVNSPKNLNSSDLGDFHRNHLHISINQNEEN